MKKVSLETTELKKIFRVMKLVTAKSNYQGVLKMIHCRVENGRLTATAMDGYRFNQFNVNCIHEEDFEFIMPVVSVTKSERTVITVNENEVEFDFGNAKTFEKIEEGTFPNIKDLIPKDDPEFYIYADPKFMKAAFEAFSGDGCVKIEFRGDTRQIVIKNKINDIAIVLPIRKNGAHF